MQPPALITGWVTVEGISDIYALDFKLDGSHIEHKERFDFPSA